MVTSLTLANITGIFYSSKSLIQEIQCFFCRLQHKVIKTFLFRHGGYMNIFKDFVSFSSFTRLRSAAFFHGFGERSLWFPASNVRFIEGGSVLERGIYMRFVAFSVLCEGKNTRLRGVKQP